jgi:hypothetical protein
MRTTVLPVVVLAMFVVLIVNSQSYIKRTMAQPAGQGAQIVKKILHPEQAIQPPPPVEVPPPLTVIHQSTTTTTTNNLSTINCFMS